jgi:hypothetical protein
MLLRNINRLNFKGLFIKKCQRTQRLFLSINRDITDHPFQKGDAYYDPLVIK